MVTKRHGGGGGGRCRGARVGAVSWRLSGQVPDGAGGRKSSPSSLDSGHCILQQNKKETRDSPQQNVPSSSKQRRFSVWLSRWGPCVRCPRGPAFDESGCTSSCCRTTVPQVCPGPHESVTCVLLAKQFSGELERSGSAPASSTHRADSAHPQGCGPCVLR